MGCVVVINIELCLFAAVCCLLAQFEFQRGQTLVKAVRNETFTYITLNTRLAIRQAAVKCHTTHTHTRNVFFLFVLFPDRNEPYSEVAPVLVFFVPLSS